MPPPSSPSTSSSPIRSDLTPRKRRRSSPPPDDRLTTTKSSSAKSRTGASTIPSLDFYGAASPPQSDPTVVQGISHEPFGRSTNLTLHSADPITAADSTGPSTSSDAKKRRLVTGRSQGVSTPMQGAHRTTRLMSLADMSFKTVQSHLSASTDRPEILEIQSYLSSPDRPLLHPTYLTPLIQTCSTSLERLDRVDRAKKAAHEARLKAKQDRPSAVVLGSGEDYNARKRAPGSWAPPPGKRQAKSQGGKKIWNKAMLASSAKSRW